MNTPSASTSTIAPSTKMRMGSICCDMVFSSYSTSRWYIRPTSSSISSSVPDSSPTMIICSTMGVKMPALRLALSMLSPCSTEVRMPLMACSMWAFSATSPASCRPSSTGTPLRSTRLRLRHTRDSAPLRTILPATGMFILWRSQNRRPCPVPTKLRSASTPAAQAASMAGHQATTNFEVPSRMRVISGSSVFRFSNTLAKAGITKMLITTIATTIASITNFG